MIQRASDFGEITGYTLRDLFFSSDLHSATARALEMILQATRALPMTYTIGMPIALTNGIINAAVTCHRDQVLCVHPKSYLPNYREFEEERYFMSAAEIGMKEIWINEQVVPCGTDILVDLGNNRGTLHVEICEDLWMPIPPSAHGALAGGTILANMSASNLTVGKYEFRQILVSASSATKVAARLYCSIGSGDSTGDVVWDGHMLIAENGRVLREGQRFVRDSQLEIADIDIQMLYHERQQQGSFRANAAQNRREFRIISLPNPLDEVQGITIAERTTARQILMRDLEPYPFVPSNQDERNLRCREIIEQQAHALAHRLEVLSRPGNEKKVIIGVSGGQDSTHALVVAAHAMDILGRPRSEIIGVTMPGFGTTGRTYKNAVALIKAIGATFDEVSVVGPAQAIFEGIGHDGVTPDLTYENTQAWMRTQTLLAIAGQRNGILLGTGDLSELAVGWCTYLGDHGSHYGINASVPKTLISVLIDWAARVLFADEAVTAQMLQDILDTPISPELVPANEVGEIAQKSEDNVGPYKLVDFFLYHFLRHGVSVSKIYRLAVESFPEMEPAEIKHWMQKFLERFFRSQFKRNCLPDGPKIGSVAVSPRGDWRMVSDVNPEIWLQEVRFLPVLRK